MSKKIAMIAVLLTLVVTLVSNPASADIIIMTAGDRPFLYEGRSYVPLKSTANFLGAPLRWNSAKKQTVISYNRQELALTPGNISALFKGQPVELSSPPVVVAGRTYVTTETFRKFYNIPVEWDKARSEVRIKGPGGWGSIKANSRPPWHGGPPPWAPAWGERRKQDARNHQSPANQEHRKDDNKQKGQ